jgi:DNA-binding MarR family transcriptional regulator
VDSGGPSRHWMPGRAATFRMLAPVRAGLAHRYGSARSYTSQRDRLFHGASERQRDSRMTRHDVEVLADFRYRLRRFLRFSEDVTRAHGMTALQYQLLLQICGYPGRKRPSVGDLAERLQAKHHGVVSLLTRCEARGWVRRTPSRADRRRVEVSVTATGRKQALKLARLHLAELSSYRGTPGPIDRTASSAGSRRDRREAR